MGAPYSGSILRWINLGIECIWLLAVLFVPLAFLDRQYAISEAVIAYVEVPKIAMLRTLAGLISILWLLEWGIANRPSSLSFDLTRVREIQFRAVISRPAAWLRSQPSHWLWLAVWFYFATVLMGTAFSASFSVSLWGEVPGQDGYPAYTIVAYMVIFGAIATHLRTTSQLWRLLGTIVVMGILVCGYSVLQHYNFDFLGLTELTGGGQSRSTSFSGNAIFAAALMSMMIPVSLLAAAASLRHANKCDGKLQRNLMQLMLTYSIAGLWVLILVVQLLGITFTFSRGPWMGTLLALAACGGMTAVFAGWGALGRIAMVLGVATGITLAVVQFDIPISNFFIWLGAAMVLVGLLSIVAFWGWRILGRVSLVLGVGAFLATVVFLMPSWFSDGLDSVDNLSASSAQSSSFTDTQVARRISSIRRDLSSGILGGRVDTWLRSWELIEDRPWFEFDELSFPWVRPLLGYGPDLFRYTYLLKSVPQGGNVPVEPDHAHNYFITQAVDLGGFGFLSSLGIFLAVFLVGGYLLIWGRNGVSPLLTLVLIGVLATLVGRFLEMMVGVARVSDLTILWVLLGILAALPELMRRSKEESQAPTQSQPSGRTSNVLSMPNNTQFHLTLPHFIRLALIAWLIGGIGILIWVKNVSYVRASIEVGEAVEHFRVGEFQDSLASLDKAIELAPDVSPYYNYRAQVYSAFHLFEEVTPENECTHQDSIPYGGCLNIKSFESNLEGVNQRPFYYRSRLALANSALNLTQNEIAFRLYGDVLGMIPNSIPLRDELGATYTNLAEAYLDAGQSEALLELSLDANEFLDHEAITAQVKFFLGIANRDLNRMDQASDFLEQSLTLPLDVVFQGRAHQALAEIYGELGRTLLAEQHHRQVRKVAEELVQNGESSLSGNKLELATEYLNDSLELFVDEDLKWRAHIGLASVYAKLDQSESSDGHRNIANEIGDTIFQAGLDLRHEGRLIEAANTIERSRELLVHQESRIQAHQILVEIYEGLIEAESAQYHQNQIETIAKGIYREGQRFRKRGQLVDAARSIEQAMELTTDEKLGNKWNKNLLTVLKELDQTEPGTSPEFSVPAQ